jgi:putative transposase
MNDETGIRHRKTIRLQGYDYSQSGYYFVTICTHDRLALFGEIQDVSVVLNDGGKIADACWRAITDHFPNVVLDEYVIMPNHVHGILIIENHVGVQNFEPLQIKTNRYQHVIPRSIGSIIRCFKIGVTKWFRQNTDVYRVWQRNFYEHIIRNDEACNRIRQYIMDNPLKWKEDEYFSE